jgi:hypothetical protein
MSTVFTPEALDRSVARGALKTARLGDFLKIDADEVFVFEFPSRNIVNRENGDGDLLEVWDAAIDYSSVTTARGDIKTTTETTIYYR